MSLRASDTSIRNVGLSSTTTSNHHANNSMLRVPSARTNPQGQMMEKRYSSGSSVPSSASTSTSVRLTRDSNNNSIRATKEAKKRPGSGSSSTAFNRTSSKSYRNRSHFTTGSLLRCCSSQTTDNSDCHPQANVNVAKAKVSHKQTNQSVNNFTNNSSNHTQFDSSNQNRLTANCATNRKLSTSADLVIVDIDQTTNSQKEENTSTCHESKPIDCDSIAIDLPTSIVVSAASDSNVNNVDNCGKVTLADCSTCETFEQRIEKQMSLNQLANQPEVGLMRNSYSLQ